MRTCSSCGAKDLAPQDMAIFPDQNDLWVVRCINCPDAIKIQWPTPAELLWMIDMTDKTPKEVRNVLNSIREAAGKERIKSADEIREYDRHTVTLVASYTRKGSDQKTTAKVKDLSKGGLCFISKTMLPPAEVIPIHIESPDKESIHIDFNSTVEIVRCTETDANTFEIGARFMDTTKKNKRKDPRHQMLLTVFYQRKGESEPHEGAILDISRSGVAMIVPEDIPVGEVLAVRIRGDSGAFEKQELRGLVRVAHTNQLYAGNYELGTEFIKTKVSNREKNTDQE